MNMVNFLIFSDLHSNHSLLNFIPKIVKKHNPNIILIPGDLTNPNNENFIFSFVKTINNPNIKLITISGNNDTKKARDLLRKNTIFIDNKKILFKDLSIDLNLEIAGVGGSNITPFNSVNEKTEEQLQKELEELNISQKTILLTHVPAYSLFDEVLSEFHTGSRAILSILKKQKPFLHISGHIHENQGITKLNNTTIIKCASMLLNQYISFSIVEKNQKPEITNIQNHFF